MAYSNSFPHTSEATESGLITQINASASSMAAWIVAIHLSDGGMSSQSTQASWPRASSTACKRRTKSASFREVLSD